MEFIVDLLIFSDLKTIGLSNGVKQGVGHGEKVRKVGTHPLQMTNGSRMIYAFQVLCNKLPQLSSLKQYKFVVPVSVGQQCECGPSGSLHRVSQAPPRCCLGYVLIWKLDWGRICFQVHSSWQNLFLCGYIRRTLYFCWLSAEATLRYQRFPCHINLFNQSFISSSLPGSPYLQNAKMGSYIMEHTHRSDIVSPLLYPIVRSKSPVLITLKGKVL